MIPCTIPPLSPKRRDLFLFIRHSLLGLVVASPRVPCLLYGIYVYSIGFTIPSHPPLHPVVSHFPNLHFPTSAGVEYSILPTVSSGDLISLLPCLVELFSSNVDCFNYISNLCCRIADDVFLALAVCLTVIPLYPTL